MSGCSEGPVRNSLGKGKRNVNNLQKHRERIPMGESWKDMKDSNISWDSILKC